MCIIRDFIDSDLIETKNLIHHTIKTSYPTIYPPLVINYFIDHHKDKEIFKRSEEGHFLVLLIEDKIIATGFRVKDEIGGVYVDPEFQRQGLGEKIINNLLQKAKMEGIERLHLDSTPMAVPLYTKAGFSMIVPAMKLIGGRPLNYFEMEMDLK